MTTDDMRLYLEIEDLIPKLLRKTLVGNYLEAARLDANIQKAHIALRAVQEQLQH